MDVDQHSIQASARKRKRNLPSASSDIEPAMFQTHTKLKTSDCVRRRMTSASVDIAELKESVSGSNDGYSDVSTHSRRSSENIYRRKPRRKTREDRYDLKSVENPPKKPKNNHGRERDGKRRRKSGSAMMHEFFAENVAPTRLTVSSKDPYCLQELIASSTDLENSSNQPLHSDSLARVEPHRLLREKDVSILYLSTRKLGSE